jgi:hypothetical protein
VVEKCALAVIKLSGGGLVGIIFAGVAVLVIIIVILVVLIRKNKKLQYQVSLYSVYMFPAGLLMCPVVLLWISFFH